MNDKLRIVSLIPSATEILSALGLEGSIVGISHECDFPKSIAPLPQLTKPKINPQLSSVSIHNDVQALLQKGLSIYAIREDLLETLKPDVIVTQDQCEVCAVSLREVEQAVCRLTNKETAICSLKPHSLDDIVADFRKVGKFTNRSEAAEDLITEFWIRLNGVNARAGTYGKYKPRVLCIEWLDPLMIGGGWIPELVSLAGGESLFVNEGEHFKTITWDMAMTAQPDVLAIMPCGYTIEKTLGELSEPKLKKTFSLFEATEKGRCFVTDGNQYFNRPGPRIADSCEILASIIQPELFKDFLNKYKESAFIEWSSL